MIKEIEISVVPSRIEDLNFIQSKASKKARLNPDSIKGFKIIRKSIDARGKQVLYRLRCQFSTDEDLIQSTHHVSSFSMVDSKPEIHIVGAGPAGYFAALQCIELGFKPIIYERGKSVRERRKDLRAIQQFGIVNPNSNYCFGEGGAGTYSDGKLYTRSHKRGNIQKVLELLVEHDAKSEILVDAHPHIGSNKLPKIVSNIRETIEKFGGEVHFDTKVIDFIIKKGEIHGLLLEGKGQINCKSVILATGHSARDIYRKLNDLDVTIESKDFAIGVRIEHPQALIDEIQYNQSIRESNLPAASYSLACQVNDKGAYSFCMCPGGLIIPAATSPGELVVNGMSLSKRDSKFANAGTVVEINKNDFENDHVFAGMEYQSKLEREFFNYGDGSQKAPAQRLTDFAAGKISSDLGDCSYIPGIYSAPVHKLLPELIAKRLQIAVRQFDKKMKGYFSREAHVVGLESRTSSPIRIPRDKSTLMHEDCKGLFPCGEGAGYAGGILSACMDGQRVAKAAVAYLTV